MHNLPTSTHTHTRISGKRFDEGIYDLTQKNILPIPPPNPKKTPNTKTHSGNIMPKKYIKMKMKKEKNLIKEFTPPLPCFNCC